MKLKTVITSVALAALAVLGTAALPAGVLATASASEGVPVPVVSVHRDAGANGFKIASDITKIRRYHQSEFVSDAVTMAFNANGGRYNVIIQNLSNNYSEKLQGVRLYANIEFDHVHYGLWVCEAGEFTNQGQLGWSNWGFQGKWTRPARNHVVFYRH